MSQTRFIENPEMAQVQMLKRLMIGGVILLITVPLCLLVDLRIAQQIHYPDLPGDVRTLLSIAEVFAHLYGVFFVLLSIFIAVPMLRKQIAAVAGMLAFTSVWVTVIKNSVMRIRPREQVSRQFESFQETFLGWNPVFTKFDFSHLAESNIQSYPSGHAAVAITLAIGMSVVFPRGKYLWTFFALLACAQRIAFSAHYLSDVVAGMVTAIFASVMFLSFPYPRKILFGIHSEPVDIQWQEVETHPEEHEQASETSEPIFVLSHPLHESETADPKQDSIDALFESESDSQWLDLDAESAAA